MADQFPFLEQVYSPVGQHKIDFVFVHGLNAHGRNQHPYETWTHDNGTFWPTFFLAEDIPYARIFVYGYNSNISNPQVMSTASVRDHADTLLNLLDMECGPMQATFPAKLIFIGHSLGGLVIKQALLNAHENPKYNAIRNATSGLVFFGCPHRGAKDVELGNVAAKVARFISNGRASNDLLECLKYDSLFTRQMSNRFRHQLEDYHVVSFIEGKPVQLGGSGPVSISHVIVDEESAVLGLTGLRETQIKLDADHSQMCKIPGRGPMYRLIKGNIQQLVNQANLSMEGDVLPIAMYPAPSLPTTPQQPLTFEPPNSSSYSFQQGGFSSTAPYPSQQLQGSTPTTVNVTGTMYPQDRTDSRSVQLAQHTNNGSWDQAKRHQARIFLEWSRNNLSKSWLINQLKFVEQYKGMNHPETQATLELLGNMHMNRRSMLKASECFSRLLNTIQDKNSPKAREIMFKIRTCILLA